MSLKPVPKMSLTEINKKILEIKKKIQLSEGQRKAAFEEYEAERKANADQILKLQKEITELNLTLQMNKENIAAHKVKNMRLETIVGPLKQRTMKQLMTTLDLHNIDNNKQLDLLKHRRKQKQEYMTKLAAEYQSLLNKKQVVDLEMIPPTFKKKIISLQNSIHRVDMQWKEAEHVKKSYLNIRAKLIDDAAKHESKLNNLQEQLDTQQKDIQHLQKISCEAAATRSAARSKLEREERMSQASARVRERQQDECRRIASERRQELERLERRIFQSGRAAEAAERRATTPPPRPDTADEQETDQEEQPTETDEQAELTEAFEKLKVATGATSTEEVLQKFQTQRDTRKRLEYLRRTTELEKRGLEIKQNKLNAELENYKYAQEMDKDKKGDSILRLKTEIQEQLDHQESFITQKQETLETLEKICRSLYNIYISLNAVGIKPIIMQPDPENGERILTILQNDFEKIIKTVEQHEAESVQDFDDKTTETNEEEDGGNGQNKEVEESLTEEILLPQTYNILLRRMPVPAGQFNAPLPAATDDEEEVPSRGFLKRQAQLIVDAKSRRKNIRVPTAKK